MPGLVGGAPGGETPRVDVVDLYLIICYGAGTVRGPMTLEVCLLVSYRPLAKAASRCRGALSALRGPNARAELSECGPSTRRQRCAVAARAITQGKQYHLEKQP